MNKREWRKRYREQREITKSWIKYADRKEAACNELRRDAVRLATELARVQAICDALESEPKEPQEEP